MNMNRLVLFLVLLISAVVPSCKSAKLSQTLSLQEMNVLYNKVKTPVKYGIVFKHPDSTKMLDSPSIFRWKDHWCMTYIIFDGQGYETWLAESKDLINWTSKGRILSFTDSTTWDANQKAGYMALLDINWGGSHKPSAFNGKYWMSYLGGSQSGYEAGQLGVGIANSSDPGKAEEWQRIPRPVLSASDSTASWFDNKTIFKSTIIYDRKRLTGMPFVMYYNASGDTANYESIGMAVSEDMIHWQRYIRDPVISRYKKGTICGDAQIVKIGDVFVMFYFGAFWNEDQRAFDRFAASYDLVHWTEWTGSDLVSPSEPYDEVYAHKPFVINWKGNVYHFYTAVGKSGRAIALATSVLIK